MFSELSKRTVLNRTGDKIGYAVLLKTTKSVDFCRDDVDYTSGEHLQNPEWEGMVYYPEDFMFYGFTNQFLRDEIRRSPEHIKSIIAGNHRLQKGTLIDDGENMYVSDGEKIIKL